MPIFFPNTKFFKHFRGFPSSAIFSCKNFKKILPSVPILIFHILGTMWAGGQVIVFFNRHSATTNLVEEKQGGLISAGLKRWQHKCI